MSPGTYKNCEHWSVFQRLPFYMLTVMLRQLRIVFICSRSEVTLVLSESVYHCVMYGIIVHAFCLIFN